MFLTMAQPTFASPKFIISILILCLAVTVCSTGPIDCPAPCKCSWILDSLKVDCSHKSLSTCPDFGSLPVDHLDLSGNEFVDFPQQLSNIGSLTYLDLSTNRISYIDSNALYGFDSLRTLLLANNSINGWSSINPNEAFRAINLKRLSLSGNTFPTFDDYNADEMLVSETLIELELEGCAIGSVGGDVLLDGLPNLQLLKLSGNELNTAAILPSQSLRVLELSNCKLQRLGQPLLAALPELEVLNLSWNSALQFSSRGDVLYADRLHTLDVSYCNIDDISLGGMPNLSNLSLRGNMLRSIDVQTFANNTLLERLDLARNSLRLLEGDVFAQLQHLSRLDLSYNEIARWDPNVFRSNKALTWLNLSRNIIEKFTILVSNSLREINFSWCEIGTVDANSLSGLSNIQRLDLSNNRLSSFPGGLRSNTLQYLDLSNCRLSALRNTTFLELSELASLHLNGNRFTNPFPVSLFNSSKYLDEIWVGDNPWICDCEDRTFVNFYNYLTAKPQKLKDKSNVRCASPPAYYGQTWEMACVHAWLPDGYTQNAGKVWTTIIMSILVLGVLLLFFNCLKKYLRSRKRRHDHHEYRANAEEMSEIRRQNQRMLEQEGTPNAPDPSEFSCLPSYEDALRMPKPVRPIKSMEDLTAANRTRKKLRRSRTQPEQEDAAADELLLDNKQRFRSEDMLSNRDKERTAQVDPFRRPVIIEYNNAGSRRFSTEESRFPAAYLKAQNMQSAERIGNFQSYENSPYTKRRSKIAEIPPFKRATFLSESVEFLTDPESEAKSKPSSPFAKRKPKASISQTDQTDGAGTVNSILLAPPVEDYFASAAARKHSRSSSPDDSDFQVLVEPELASLADDNGSSSASGAGGVDLERGKRKKRKNSTSRRASGNFSAAAAAGDTSSSSDREAIVVVHKPPMRETLF